MTLLIGVMLIVGWLLLREPDFGAFVVITSIAMAILFLGGMNVKWFGGLMLMLALGFAGRALVVRCIATGVLLAGPFVCATSQAVNDWFDRHVDAINEPNRPIPSGRMPGAWGLYIALAWTLLSSAETCWLT